MRNIIKWSYLGCVAYTDAVRIQENLRNNIIKGMDDTAGYLLILEHKPVITTGKFGNKNNLLINETVLRKKGINLVRTNRGGDYTYHGPGQLVCYPVLSLKKIGLGIKKYVCSLEDVIINTLKSFGISAHRRSGYPGVWVGNKKIAFIGINVKRHVSMHGFSLNYDVDHNIYSYMNPCGINGLEVVSLSNLLSGELQISMLVDRVVTQFMKLFKCELIEDKRLAAEIMT